MRGIIICDISSKSNLFFMKAEGKERKMQMICKTKDSFF